MNLFINKIVSSILQIILFGIIPFVWWLITARKHQKFTEWIGLKKIEGMVRKLYLVLSWPLIAFYFRDSNSLCDRDIETATSDFTGLGVAAIPAIVIYAAFNTAFPEELLFRGFILKRLTNKFGFNIANFTQALLFGLLHGLMFYVLVGAVKTILIITLTGAYCMVYGVYQRKKLQWFNYSKLDYPYCFQFVFRNMCCIFNHISTVHVDHPN